ncbi:MAG: hypothetical protein IPM54_23905 [Polyangiaceae bacterium]|nr:hypothetical protein [Polyangiaceae bacterium]
MAAPRDGYLAVFTSARSDAGRAMALANIAALLAQRGDRVLVIDLAVDSPTLARYFPDASKRRVAGATGRARVASGVVDLLALVREGARRMPPGRTMTRTTGTGLAHELVERVFDLSESAVRRVNVRYPGLPDERMVELHFMPVGGDDAPHERAQPFESLDLFPGVLEDRDGAAQPLRRSASSMRPRARWRRRRCSSRTSRTNSSFWWTTRLSRKRSELASWAHGRRSLASTDRTLNMFPLLMHVPDGAAGKAFVDEAKPRLEAFFIRRWVCRRSICRCTWSLRRFRSARFDRNRKDSPWKWSRRRMLKALHTRFSASCSVCRSRTRSAWERERDRCLRT